MKSAASGNDRSSPPSVKAPPVSLGDSSFQRHPAPGGGAWPVATLAAGFFLEARFLGLAFRAFSDHHCAVAARPLIHPTGLGRIRMFQQPSAVRRPGLCLAASDAAISGSMYDPCAASHSTSSSLSGQDFVSLARNACKKAQPKNRTPCPLQVLYVTSPLVTIMNTSSKVGSFSAKERMAMPSRMRVCSSCPTC